jgi:hypothetical protein
MARQDAGFPSGNEKSKDGGATRAPPPVAKDEKQNEGKLALSSFHPTLRGEAAKDGAPGDGRLFSGLQYN